MSVKWRIGAASILVVQSDHRVAPAKKRSIVESFTTAISSLAILVAIQKRDTATSIVSNACSGVLKTSEEPCQTCLCAHIRKRMADAESTGDADAEEACPDGRGAAAIGRGVAGPKRTDGRTRR